jgi:hypothetical protein
MWRSRRSLSLANIRDSISPARRFARSFTLHVEGTAGC